MAHPAHPIAAQTLIDLTDPPTIHGHAKIGPIKLHELLNHEQVLGVRAQRIAKRQFEELSSKSWLKAQLAFYNLEPPRGTSSQELLELLRQCVKDELVCIEDPVTLGPANGLIGLSLGCSFFLRGKQSKPT